MARKSQRIRAMDDDLPTYEVVALGDAALNEDGNLFRFTFVLRDAQSLGLALPTRCLLPLAANAFVASNQAHAATAGTEANLQILQAESVEIYPTEKVVDFHFRLSGTKTDFPVSLPRQVAQSFSERLGVDSWRIR